MAEPRVNHGNPPPPSKSFIAPAEDKNDPLVTATVARGRSVMVSTGRRVVGYHDITKEPIYAPEMKLIDELQEVKLPASEVKRMRAGGYLIDPDKLAALDKSEGPSFMEIRDRHPQVQGPSYGR